MEGKQSPSSVIAKLMGFDEVSPPRQPVCRPNRVLSEVYLRKSDSICVLERQSYCKRGQRSVNSIEVQGREKLHRNSSGSVGHKNAHLRSELADESCHLLPEIVILRSNFLSLRKTNNQLFEKWKRTRGANQEAVTRQRDMTEANRHILDKLESKSGKGNDGEEISKFYSNLEYEKATKDSKVTPDARRESGHGYEILAENLKRFYECSEGNHFESTYYNSNGKVELCSHIFDDLLIRQEQSVSPSYSKIDPVPHMSPGDYYSPSPNSVLDPILNEEILSSSDSYEDKTADPKGLQKQLQLLESKSEEHEMVLSSDEDVGDESVDYYNENIKFLRLVSPEESRDSSYMDDVLDEASIFRNDSKEWNSMECPLNRSLFEMLEKKYEKQSSWEKSERRLLFDRINLGLKHILYPYVDVFGDSIPLRIRFKLSQSREVIEDELWKVLVSHENGVNKTLSEKAVGTETKWFDLHEDIDYIVCEIEQFLFEKILAELLND